MCGALTNSNGWLRPKENVENLQWRMRNNRNFH